MVEEKSVNNDNKSKKEQDFCPYWKDQYVEKSKRILDSLERDNNNLWKEFLSSHVEKYGKDKTKIGDFKSRSTRIYPTKEQKKILQSWIDDGRFMYNTIVGKFNGTSKIIHKFELYKEFVTFKDTKITDSKILATMERTPKDIRAKAVFEACAAHDLSLSKTRKLNPKYVEIKNNLKVEKKKLAKIEKNIEQKNKDISDLKNEKEILEKSISASEKELENIESFINKTSNLKFRRKKDQYSHIFIPKNSGKINGNKLNIYPKFKDKIGEILVKKNKINKITSDFIIRKHNKLDVWNIITFSPTEIVKNDNSQSKTIIIDPGVRTFLTCLDYKGNISEIGKGWSQDKKIKKRIEKLDKNSSIRDSPIKGKRGLERLDALKAKRNVELHRRKLINMINELHKKTAVDLFNNYDIIVLPKLRSKNLLKREGLARSLGSKTNRNINLISHCKFHDYLSWKAKINGKIVINQDESYTTQTCFECGTLNQIGAGKDYKCSKCLNVCDRDVQSCFNILTKYMSSYSSQH